MKKKIVIFDLYDTILKDISFNFKDGIKYLHTKYFSDTCTLEELINYADTFLPLYEKRNTEHNEICLIKDEIPLFFDKFNVNPPSDYEKLDYEIMKEMQKVTLPEDVKNVLEQFYSQNIVMYILSNSIFTGRSTEKLLQEFGILQYFKKVYSSADYGIRKPSAKFYNIAIDEILSENPGLSKKDILYVGNDYNTDIKGASGVGLDAVWYNVNHLPDLDNIKVVEIDNFRKILEVIK